jgi:hypothetical protein
MPEVEKVLIPLSHVLKPHIGLKSIRTDTFEFFKLCHSFRGRVRCDGDSFKKNPNYDNIREYLTDTED